ncbi:hypothetical protein AAFC00_002033 [Neodothiora populina]|uniref:Bromo domain-containing protein n=1 Tax=Neodothiora populina TaxID=2781224 RepID=A0ABR3PG23_9PEZI
MTNLSSYTPLESLLLFQALQEDGVSAIPFGKISNQLQNIPLIRNDTSYDSARLEPTALKDLYLGLLNEEAKKDGESRDGDAQDVLKSPKSRKRRAPTPSLPTVDEAIKHAHLIPKLILRLYCSYREKVVEEIRNDERQYDHLSQEIKQIESGAWDERLRKEHVGDEESTVSTPAQPLPPPKEDQQPEAVPQTTQSSLRPILPGPDREQVHTPPVGNQISQTRDEPDDKDVSSPEKASNAKIEAVINHEPGSARSSASPRDGRPPTISALPPLSEMAPDDPTTQKPLAPQSYPPPLPPPLQPGPAYRASPPIGVQSGFPAPYPRPGSQAPIQSPKLPDSLPRSSPSSSPRLVLPLPPGMKMTPQSPVMQSGSPGHRHAPLPQGHRSPHHYPSPTQRLPVGPTNPHERNAPRGGASHLPSSGYPQAYQPYQGAPQPYPQPPSNRQSPASFPARHPQQQAPSQGGVQLPPFQVGAQDPSRAHQMATTAPRGSGQQQPQQQQMHGTPPTPAAPFPPYAPYGTPAAPLSQQPQQLRAQQHRLQHPPRTPQTPQTPQTPRVDQEELVQSIVSALRVTPWPTWKAARPAHLPQPHSDRSPMVEPLSPVQQRAFPPPKLLAAKPAEAQEQTKDDKTDETAETSRRENADEARTAAKEASPEGLPAPSDAKLAPTPAKSTRSTRKSTRRSRAGSAASSNAANSSARARTRSQSVVSHAESQPAASEASASGRHVKDEPTTPAEFPHQEILRGQTPVVETPTTLKATRQRRSTLLQAQAQVQTTSKRKRQRSPSPPIEEQREAVPTYMPPRNDIVAASRNFQRLSAVIMNDISTHKHAGPFQKPVREKDAEGYTDIIKRPQDLKSIKAAITAGYRAISATAAATAAASSTDSPAATPGGSSSNNNSLGTKDNGATILLEKSADLVPPRAIVNSAQLEKEVMRMFANAVMFNPGEGGMVLDAREMADDIEAKVRDWRSAERQVDGGNNGSGRGDDEDEAGGVRDQQQGGPVGKRRKM